MYDIKLDNKKIALDIYSTFFIVGLVMFLGFGAFILHDRLKEKNMDSEVMSHYVEIKENLSSDGTKYSPVYYYEVNGKEYKCETSVSSKKKPSKENKKIKYKAEKPSYCILKGGNMGKGFVVMGLGFPMLCMILGIKDTIKILVRIRTIKKLNKTGKLIKNLPYHMKCVGTDPNDKKLMKPIVAFTLPDGTPLVLEGDVRYDLKHSDADGLIDVIIDEKNPKRYFMDFEINRLTGNLKEDYYVFPKTQSEIIQQMDNEEPTYQKKDS